MKWNGSVDHWQRAEAMGDFFVVAPCGSPLWLKWLVVQLCLVFAIFVILMKLI